MVYLGLDVVARTGVPLGLIAVGTGNDITRHRERRRPGRMGELRDRKSVV